MQEQDLARWGIAGTVVRFSAAEDSQEPTHELIEHAPHCIRHGFQGQATGQKTSCPLSDCSTCWARLSPQLLYHILAFTITQGKKIGDTRLREEGFLLLHPSRAPSRARAAAATELTL